MLSSLLAPHVRSSGGRTALVYDGRAWSYAELAACAGSLAAAMASGGLAGERVAIMLPNSPETVLVYLACFASGAVATPLNSRYAPPEIESALRRARPRWVVVAADRLDRLARVDPAVLGGVRILVVGSADSHESLGPLLRGASADLPDPEPDAPAILFFTSGSTGVPKGVVHTHASALAMLTSTSEALAQVVRAPGACRNWFSSLRGVYTGGDTVPAALQKDFLALTGLPIAVGWGMTEAIWLTIVREPRLERDGCIGRPVGGVEVRADAVTGELLVRGPMVMRGYWEDEPLTATTLSSGWLHTGDLGHRDADGVWWFAGRSKDVIVRRTSKITPGEVEAALDLHPAVAMAAVVGAPDAAEGEVPVAYVQTRPGHDVTADELRTFLAEQIAAYKIPARIHFRDHLPLTASGKIDRRALRQEP